MEKCRNWFTISVVIWAVFVAYVVGLKINAVCGDDAPTTSEMQAPKADEDLEWRDANIEPPTESPRPFYQISQGDRECLSYIISGEAWAEPIEGKMAVAQCLLNAMRQDGLSAEEVRAKYQYAGWKTNLEEVDPENWQQVLDVIERVFDNGETVTDENIMWFYSPKYCTSEWHETQKYVGTWGTQRFFAPRNL